MSPDAPATLSTRPSTAWFFVALAVFVAWVAGLAFMAYRTGHAPAAPVAIPRVGPLEPS
jgi:hypothetical protein